MREGSTSGVSQGAGAKSPCAPRPPPLLRCRATTRVCNLLCYIRRGGGRRGRSGGFAAPWARAAPGAWPRMSAIVRRSPAPARREVRGVHACVMKGRRPGATARACNLLYYIRRGARRDRGAESQRRGAGVRGGLRGAAAVAYRSTRRGRGRFRNEAAAWTSRSRRCGGTRPGTSRRRAGYGRGARGSWSPCRARSRRRRGRARTPARAARP